MNRNNIDTPIDSIEYQNCYVAFLDMLGFSNICKNKSMSCSDILKILSVNSVINSSIIGSVENNPVARHFFPADVTKSIYYSIMSDSIFIATPNNKAGLQYMLQICTIIQNFLLENKILLRGGITKGEFFGDNDIAFGPALVDAHYIEETIAIYPRIVLSKEVIDDINTENDSYADLLYKQSKEDSLYFINHLNPLELRRMNSDPDNLTKIHNFIKEGCQNNNLKIKAKYQWVNNYFERSLKSYKTIFPSEKELKKLTEDLAKFIQERNKDTNA